MGKFVRGKSGNPHGRPLENEEVKRLARLATPLAMQKLKEILERPNEDSRAIIAAAKEILDRAVGKAAQSVEVSGKDGGPIRAIIEEVSAR